MRVIAGRHGGRRIHAPSGRSTRPTADRVREALFSLLGSVEGLRVLDLYAGSGALGLEALSRGASHVTLVEASRSAASCIDDNLALLGVGAESAQLIRSRVEDCRSRIAPGAPFDLVLCDPPWADLARCVAALPRVLVGLVGEGAILVLEHAANEPPHQLGSLAGPPFDQRSYGDTGLSLFRVSRPDP